MSRKMDQWMIKDNNTFTKRLNTLLKAPKMHNHQCILEVAVNLGNDDDITWLTYH